MHELEIRLMLEDDLARVAEILGHWGMAPVQPGSEFPELEDSGLAVGRTLVAVAQGRLVGCASYVVTGPHEASTESLAVDPAWVGKGVGEQLQRARLQALRALGVRHVSTTADRPSTIAWYVSRFGYRVTGTLPKRHAFGLSQVPDWTVLELDLD